MNQPTKRHVLEPDYLSLEQRAALKAFDEAPAGAYILERSTVGERTILPRTSILRDALTLGHTKRGSVPPTPGFMNCPATNAGIDQDCDGCDDDVYSDCAYSTLG